MNRLSRDETMHRVDDLLSHVWMVRAFLKHCEEAEDDEELRGVQRGLYDYMLALGGPLKNNAPDAYVRQAKKKLAKLRRACATFVEIQPEVSGHTNFEMAARSLTLAVDEIEILLGQDKP